MLQLPMRIHLLLNWNVNMRHNNIQNEPIAPTLIGFIAAVGFMGYLAYAKPQAAAAILLMSVLGSALYNGYDEQNQPSLSLSM